MRCSTVASVFLAAHQMLRGRFGSAGLCSGPCSFYLPPSRSRWPVTLGARPCWGHGCVPGRSRPSAHALLRAGGAGAAVGLCGEGRLFGAYFNVKLLVSSSLVIIHHTERPCPLRGLLALVLRSGAAGCSGANGETRSVFLPLRLLAPASLARSPAGGIGSWLPPTGDGVWMSIVLVRSPGLPAPPPCRMCRHLRCGTGTCGRTWGFGGETERRSWIFCRK